MPETRMSVEEARGYLMSWDTWLFGRRMTKLAWLVLFGSMCATGEPVFLIGLVTIPCFMFLGTAILNISGAEQRAAEARNVIAAETRAAGVSGPGKGESPE